MACVTRLLAAAILLCATTITAHAQAPTARIRGTIQSLEGNTLTVTTREGPVVKITLTEPLSVGTVKKAELSAITTGTYVGAAAVPGADGKLSALEVLIFPEAARGTGEGHRPWDLAPNSSMTNASVDAVVQANAGNVLTLKYKDGSVTIAVPPGTPIVKLAPAAREDLKPGQTVFIGAAARAADGTLSTGRVTVSKDGVAPPM